MVVPMAAALCAPVYFEHNLLRFDLYSRDLYLITHSPGWAAFPHRILPSAGIVSAVAMEHERLLGARECNLQRCKFRVEAAGNLHPLIEAEVVRPQSGAKREHKAHHGHG